VYACAKMANEKRHRVMQDSKVKNSNDADHVVSR
jgi:hypothetical protein